MLGVLFFSLISINWVINDKKSNGVCKIINNIYFVNSCKNFYQTNYLRESYCLPKEMTPLKLTHQICRITVFGCYCWYECNFFQSCFISITRGPKGHITCTWVQCAIILTAQPGWPFLFTDRPKIHKLGGGCLELASCQVSLNSIQWFQRRSQNCPSQSEAKTAILTFQSARKTQTWYGTLGSCFLSVSLDSVQQFQKRGQKCLSQSEARGPSRFSDQPQKHKLRRVRWDLASYRVSLNSIQQFQRSRKCLSQSEAGAAI